MLKIVPVKLEFNKRSNNENSLFGTETDLIQQISDNIKNYFNNRFFRETTTEGWWTIKVINSKRINDKLVCINPIDWNMEPITEISNVNWWKMFFLRVQSASIDEDHNNTYLARDDEVTHEVISGEYIFEEYYVGIYLSPYQIWQENINWYMFYLVKNNKSIYWALKKILSKWVEHYSITFDYITNEKNITELENNLSNVIIWANIPLTSFFPTRGDMEEGDMVSTEIRLKPTNNTNYKKIVKHAKDWDLIIRDMWAYNVRATIDLDWSEQVMDIQQQIDTQERETFMCLIRKDKKLWFSQLNFDSFKREVINYYNEEFIQ